MIKEARGYGATIDEAKENAMASLNAGADEDIQFEVISTPKKKTLGLFGGSRAEVRVYVDVPDVKPKREPKQENKPKAENKYKTEDKPKAENKPAAKQENKPRPENKPAAKQENKPKPENKPAQKTESSQTPVQKSAREEVKPEAKQETKQPRRESEPEVYAEAVAEEALSPDSQPAKAIKYLKSVLAGLGCENVSFKAAEGKSGALITIEGDGLGVVIGRRGETLDALQYLTSLAANNGSGYYKVALDIGNYREKREQALVGLAQRVSAQVLKSGRSRSLEPMNPYERRIIHTAVQEIEGVVSNSFGEGSARRVVIAPEGGDTRPPKREDDRRDRHDRTGRDGRRSGRDGRDRKPSSTVATSPTREPKKDSDIPLYGKIG